MTGLSLALVLILPAALAVAMSLPVLRGAAWRLMPLAPLPALALALLTPAETAPDAWPVLRGDWLVLGSELGLDPVSRLFLAFTAILWVAAGSAARHWLRGDPRGAAFGVCFLMAMTGNLGLILARDAASFYAFFALMSFASYGLVLHEQSDKARAAARVYIGFVIAGELALFAGLALAAAGAGSLMLADLRASAPEGLAALLLMAGFGVKLGLVPLHFWLPPAHGAAPVPASAVLSGAMIKAGLFGMIATLPLGVVAFDDLGPLVMSAGLVTIFAALLLGVQQDNPKAVLGFSSVSQMGILALGLGAGMLAPEAWPAILPVLVFLAAHHALAKGALFLGVGAVAAQAPGAGRWLMLGALALPALVLAGLPATSGALGKEALKAALAEGSAMWLPWLVLALTLSGAATTLLMARHLFLLARKTPPAPQALAPEAIALPFFGLALGAITLPGLWPWLAGPLAAPLAQARPGAFWPVAAGLAVAVGAGLYARAQRIGPAVFAAQLLAPVSAARARLTRAAAIRQRGLRRLSARVPRQITARATDWRLGQSAILILIALVMALHQASGPRAGVIPDPQVTPQGTSGAATKGNL